MARHTQVTNALTNPSGRLCLTDRRRRSILASTTPRATIRAMRELARRALSGGALGLWAGALGGALAGLVEAVSAWSAAAQYLPDAPGRFALLAFLAALEGLFGALV